MEEKGSTNGQSYMEDMLNMSKDDVDIVSGVSEVSKFFEGLNIFVTGASGFVGKLLVDKLLRSCPKLGTLYMLMRAKKGKTPEERFKEYFDDPLYDTLKREQPDYISHISMIEGDTSASDLGLSVRDRETLIENVHVVFHGAATVRFDEALRRVVHINLRGTKLLLQLAKEMKNVKAFVHISTAFSHCISKHIEEKFYESPIEPDKILALVELLDDDLLLDLTPKLVGKWPNTYAFSKAVCEELVRQYSTGLPTCIVRPSIMIATYKEPVSGWINNFYGPTGVVAGAALGLLRTLHCNSTNIADIIPADYVINNIIVGAWDTAKKWEEEQQIIEGKETPQKIIEPPIYNSVASCQKPIDWGTFMYLNEINLKSVPSTLVLWHYMLILNKHLWVHHLCCFLLHTIPALIIDALAIMIGRKPVLTKAYKKIHKFTAVISYFSAQQWKFNNDNVIALWNRTNPVDRRKFDFNLENLNWNEYFYHQARGLRVFLLKDPLHTIEKGRVKCKQVQYGHYALVTVLSLLLGWALYGFLRLLISLCPYFQ